MCRAALAAMVLVAAIVESASRAVKAVASVMPKEAASLNVQLELAAGTAE